MARAGIARNRPGRRERDESLPAKNDAFLTALNTKSLYWPLFILLLVAGTLLTIFPVGQGEEDIWWHLKTGDWILANKALPFRDLFTYTTAPGTHWIDTQWFFQAVAAAIYGGIRWNGLIVYRIVCVLALVVLAWKWLGELGAAPAYRFLCITMVFFGAWFRIAIRPELPTFALVAAHLWLYERSARTGKIAFVPLLVTQLFWANWHSSCILGIGLAVIFAGTELWKRRRVTSTRSAQSFSVRSLVLLPVLMFAITLLNPHGWHAPFYALTESRRTYIMEFRPPTWRFFIAISGLILVVSALGVRQLIRRGNWFTVAVVVLFAIQSARMVRFFPYLAIASVPLQLEGFRVIAALVSSLGRSARIGASAAVMALLVGGAVLSVRMEPHPILRTGLDDVTAPVAAADFVLKEKISGNLFNEFDNGGYLLWRFAPERKVFMFAESSLNGPLEDRVARLSADDSYRKVFDKYQATYAVINCPHYALEGQGASLANTIFSSWKDWYLVFWDDVAMVFVKDLPKYKDLIARRTCRLYPEPIPSRQNPMTDVMALDTMLNRPADWPAIEQELLRAIEDSPQHFKAALALGNMREARKDPPDKVFEAYRTAESVYADSPELQQCLGRWHLNHGSAEKAIEYETKAIAGGARGPFIYCVLAEAQLKTGQREAARSSVQRALREQPDFGWALQLKQKLGI